MGTEGRAMLPESECDGKTAREIKVFKYSILRDFLSSGTLPNLGLVVPPCVFGR